MKATTSDNEQLNPLFEFLDVANRSHNQGRPRGLQERGVAAVYGLQSKPTVAEIRRVRAQRPSLLLLMSDEKLRHRLRSYGPIPRVLREYYKPGWLARKQWSIPLFPTSFAFTVGEAVQSSRSIDFTFVGQKKGDRADMLALFALEERTHLHLTKNFNDQVNGYPPEKLAQIYSDSVFVLCPFGNVNPDTFRVMEALYRGAIPVSIKMGRIDYFEFIYGRGHPFIIGDSWQHALDQCRALIDDPSALADYRAGAQAWFFEFLQNLSHDLGQILSQEDSDPLLSSQWSIQRKSRFKIQVLWEFGHRFWFKPAFRKVMHRIDEVARRARETRTRLTKR